VSPVGGEQGQRHKLSRTVVPNKVLSLSLSLSLSESLSLSPQASRSFDRDRRLFVPVTRTLYFGTLVDFSSR